MSTDLDELLDLVATLGPEAAREALDSLPPSAVEALLSDLGAAATADLPASPIEQAVELESGYVERPHLRLISERIAAAISDVELGRSRRIIVETPPRSGKTALATIQTPLWVLRRHPEWPIALVSHDATLATSWGREIRRYIEGSDLGLRLAPDAGAASEWQTVNGGGVISRSIGGSFTGRGAQILVIDDPHKDHADAHSELRRAAIWEWWLSVAQTRLQPPSLVVVIMTRWHEDDLVGRLLSDESEGDPDDWEVIRLPALADGDARVKGDALGDPLGRAVGEPLLSPLIPAETPPEATDRWEKLRRDLGSYVFSALIQQAPSPSQGSIFNIGWWRYWTPDPARADRLDDGSLDPNGRIVYFDPEIHATPERGARWIDSWDMAFKDTRASDYVVGQRWVAVGPRKFLIEQTRERRSFTSTLATARAWSTPSDPAAPRWTDRVHERLVEDKANGTAVIDALRARIPGLHPVNPTTSKRARAIAVSPDVEAGDVFLPLPVTGSETEWVRTVYLPEFRDFDAGAHDDQVDSTTQALTRLRTARPTTISVPGRSGRSVDRGVRSRPGPSPEAAAGPMPARVVSASARRISRR